MKPPYPLPYLVAFIIILGFTLQGYSQTCGFDIQHQHLLRTSNLYKNQLAAVEAKANALLADREFMKVDAPVYRIPVVVHVIHNGL